MTMRSAVCADAGLARKLVFREPDSDRARALWDEWRMSHTTVVVPSLWRYEVTSVIRNRVQRELYPPDQEEEAFATVHLLPVEVVQPVGLHRRAWELARHFNRPAAYDAHYLAVAEMVGCPFWTADRRLYNAVHDELAWVCWLADYAPGEYRP